ncbi:MAG: potassium channel family protein [Candidatus Methylomirabilia bacterium]
MATLYSVLFHFLMAREGREFSWMTGLYWTLTTMSTLGFGDITFTSDLGRFFSMWVLLSGMVFLLILLPFTFIQFFYAPWMEAQSVSRAPQELPRDTAGHVVLTHYDEVTAALINKLTQYHYPYVLLVPDLPEALRLHDRGLKVVLGDLSNPETYRRVRVEKATLVATTCSDVVNTNVASTVREMSANVSITATANASASVDILDLAGATHVLQLGEMMGKSLARRTIGGDAMAHVIGEFDQLLIAETTVARTPLVGKTLRECRLRERANITVVGVWDRGQFQTAGPETRISPNTVLVLAGSQSQLDSYNRLFSLYRSSKAPVVIIGGGRVGRATGRALAERGIDYCIIEQLPERVRDPEKYVFGNAAELEILKKAGIMEAANVVITTHDDDTNVYLTIYCRRLRSDIQIIARATFDRNISTLHRAGADFVMSYASMGANTIFNLLKRSDILVVTEGLDFFRMKLPASLADKTIVETSIAQETGCSIIAINADNAMQINPDPTVPLPADTEIILIGTVEAENRFLELYGD